MTGDGLVRAADVLDLELMEPGLDNDAQAIARAESAIADLAPGYRKGVLSEIDRIIMVASCAKHFLGQNMMERTLVALDEILRASVEIRDIAATFNYPFCTKVARSLCRIVGDTLHPGVQTIEAIEGHLEILQTLFRDNVMGCDEDYGKQLDAELSALRRRAARVLDGDEMGERNMRRNGNTLVHSPQ